MILSVKRNNWRSEDISGDKDFATARKTAKELSKNACAFCGHVSEKYNEGHHLNGNHDDNDASNIAMTCCMCHGVFHIGFIGLKKKGSIIYMPELSQIELNRLSRMLFICLNHQSFQKYKRQAEDTYEQLHRRSSFIDEAYAEGWSDPATLGQQLLDLSDEDYMNRKKIVGDMRIMYFRDAFTNQVKHWGDAMHKSTPASSWDALVERSPRK